MGIENIDLLVTILGNPSDRKDLIEKFKIIPDVTTISMGTRHLHGPYFVCEKSCDGTIEVYPHNPHKLGTIILPTDAEEIEHNNNHLSFRYKGVIYNLHQEYKSNK